MIESLLVNLGVILAVVLAFWQRTRKLQDQLRDNEFKHINHRLDRIEERLDRLEARLP